MTTLGGTQMLLSVGAIFIEKPLGLKLDTPGLECYPATY